MPASNTANRVHADPPISAGPDAAAVALWTHHRYAVALTYFWGLVQPKDIDPKCEAAANHLNKVVVKTNIGYILLSAITLGMVIPQHVEWCCAPQNIPTDTLGKKP